MKNDNITFRVNSQIKRKLIELAEAEKLNIGDFITYKLYPDGQFCPQCKHLISLAKFKKGSKIVCDSCKHEFKAV